MSELTEYQKKVNSLILIMFPALAALVQTTDSRDLVPVIIVTGLIILFLNNFISD